MHHKHFSLSQSLASSLIACGMLSSPALALNIILVTTGGGSLQTFLENEGHNLTVGQFTTVPDGATIAGNDLIIVTRETSSSNYSNDTGEALAWNQFNIPIINMAPHIMRESRWGWESGEGLPTVANITSFNAFPDIGHPFFENLSAPETEAFTDAITIRSVDGNLPPSTSVLATYGSNNLFGIFIIPEGSPMFGGLGAAGADRVGFLRGEDNSWNDANSNMQTILRNMISFYDPALAGDSDSDGLDDNFEEAIINADPNDALITIADVLPGDDFDNDNLTNQEEHDLSPRTDPTDSDSDGDTLSDGEEVSGELNPFDATGNNVGIPNGAPSNPNLADSDFDGADDQDELAGGTDLNNPDTDGDGIDDGYEYDNSAVADGGLDPLLDDALLDPDSDGSNNLEEFQSSTFPGDPDSDDDGSNDGAESTNDTNPLNPDSDSDGLLDGVESNSGTFVDSNDTGTDPLSENSDDDSFRDGAEVNLHNTDPNDPASQPNLGASTLFIGGAATAPTVGQGDFLIIQFLEDKFGIGQVTYVEGGASASGDENGFDLVAISATNNSPNVRGKFNLASVPVVNWERLLNDETMGNFGLSNNIITSPADLGVSVVNLLAGHPITSGLPSPLTIYEETVFESYYTNNLGPATTAIATGAQGAALDNPMFMVVDTGEALAPGTGAPGDLAPARRVFFPFDNNSWGGLSENGYALVSNMIDWAVEGGTTGTSSDLEITHFSYDDSSQPGNVIAEITFNSTAGQNYEIISTPDLAAPANVIIPNITGTGGPVTRTINFIALGLNPATPKHFFFVREN